MDTAPHLPVSPGDIPDRPIRPGGSSAFVRRYLTGIFLLVSLLVFSVFLGFSYRSSLLFKEQLHRQAVSFFQEVVLTREWAAHHGGVYVKMLPGVVVNPYLRAIPGLKVVIADEQGVQYTLRNPALITREISEIAAKKGLFQFRITSLKPLNPHNAPDAFEAETLRAFERGTTERAGYEPGGSGTVYRYMAPLLTQPSCLQCHAAQGYRVGDVRGGISVSIPATDMLREVRQNWIFLLLSAAGIVVVVFGLIRYISHVFVKDLKAAERQLIDFASRDFLTGLLNRREALARIEQEQSRAARKGSPLSVILLDIDHFKRFNDTYGHAVGDAVLEKVGRAIYETLRKYDTVCRWGGEEFLAATPEASLADATHLAERVRQAVAEISLAAETGRDDVRVTFSAGVAEAIRGEGIERTISRADEALLRAKGAGRDRVIQAVAGAEAGQAAQT